MSYDARATTSSGRAKGYPGRSRSAPIRAATSRKTVVAALGDSITEGSPGLVGWDQWAAGADASLEIRNCGIYGQRTDEIAARLEDCVRGADVLIVQGGINDIAQGRDVAQAASNLRLMVRRGKELGLRVALADVLPWNNGWPDAEPEIRRLNALITGSPVTKRSRCSRSTTRSKTPTDPAACARSGRSKATIRTRTATAGLQSWPSGCPRR